MTGRGSDLARQSNTRDEQVSDAHPEVNERLGHDASLLAQGLVPPCVTTGPMPASFDISSFSAPATTSTTPTRRTVTMDGLVALLTKHERRRNKDGRGWSGATYKAGTTR